VLKVEEGLDFLVDIRSIDLRENSLKNRHQKTQKKKEGFGLLKKQVGVVFYIGNLGGDSEDLSG
jgi:hypothetical protein